MSEPTGRGGRAEAVRALVVGAGPAGLMAAEVLSEAGVSVVVADQMPTPARKFLMAGKSGLNLTKVDDGFEGAYGEVSSAFARAVADLRLGGGDAAPPLFPQCARVERFSRHARPAPRAESDVSSVCRLRRRDRRA